MRKIALIAKGNSTKTKRYFNTLNLSKYQKDFQIDLSYTSKPQHAIELANHFSKKQYDLIVACGGDGTSFEVINGMLQNNLNTSAFGVLPIGSANDFARAQKLSTNFSLFVKKVEKWMPRKIDLGEITLLKGNQTVYFLNICDVGFGAAVAKKISGKKHILPPELSFLWAITKTLVSYQNQPISIEYKNQKLSDKTLLVSIANSTCFGGGIYISPSAKIDDGTLNLTKIGDISVVDYLLQIGKLKKRKELNHPKVSYDEVKEIEIKGLNHIGIEADGEYVGELPCKISVKPSCLSFIETSP